jgi:signal transduction histidine kinase
MKNFFDDTLFKRVFLLMWIALVLSHLAGFLSVQQLMQRPDGLPHAVGLPPMPSLPPIGRPEGGPEGLPEGGPPVSWLWIDYLVRGLVIALGAWFGARWLSAPMRRLADASRALGRAVGTGSPAPMLDERRGTLEVRQTAEVFNTMARQLHGQFAAQALLMAAISHDLRTPLARLRLRLEQMGTTQNTERCISDVREMDQLIASVLDMMQLSHEPAARQQVDVRSLVQSLADDMAEQGQAVTLRDDPGNPAPAVASAHPVALHRVLDNLVSNALRHAGSAEISIQVQATQLRVWVDDRGPGIPADQLEAVFQPFYRVDASRSKQTGGSGLGLYIARDLARRQGGEVTLARREGGGLRAVLSVPLSQPCQP